MAYSLLRLASLSKVDGGFRKPLIMEKFHQADLCQRQDSLQLYFAIGKKVGKIGDDNKSQAINTFNDLAEAKKGPPYRTINPLLGFLQASAGIRRIFSIVSSLNLLYPFQNPNLVKFLNNSLQNALQSSHARCSCGEVEIGKEVWCSKHLHAWACDAKLDVDIVAILELHTLAVFSYWGTQGSPLLDTV